MVGQKQPASSIIDPVEATSCKNKAWDPAASRQNALAQLRLKAIQLGGMAVANVARGSDGTNLATNCWESVNCMGTAVRTKDGPAAEEESEDAKKSANAEDKVLCIEFGYKPGTKDYANYRENLHQKREEAEQTALTRQAAAQQSAAANQAAIAGAIIAKGPPQYNPVAVQPFPKIEPYMIPPAPRPITTDSKRDPVLTGNMTCTSE